MNETATVMYQVFHRLDKDNSGFLNKDEIMGAISNEPELKLRAARISDLLIAWHKDQDKKIHYDEFVKVWIKYKV
jgi:Ca2+-binding EF-hand superfamily protein